MGSQSLDSDALPAAPDSPTARTAPFSLSTAITLDDDPDGLPLTNPTFDAGVTPLVSLGDLVWVDADADGLYDPATESGIAGVTVTLLDAAGQPAVDPAGAPIAPTTTDAAGRYSFVDLVPGSYRVRFTLPTGYVWTDSNAGALADDDLDNDSVPDTAAVDSPTATTGVVVLSTTLIPDGDPDGLDLTDPTIDAGVVPLLSLGDVVWIDADGDGVLDPTEAGVPGSTVRLLDTAGQPAKDAFGNDVAPATTGPDGRYSFDEVAPGTYVVEFTLPSGFVWTTANAPAGNDDLDSDAAFVERDDATVRTAPIVLTPTVVADSDPDRLPGLTNGTIDAGVVPLLSLGDLVWIDLDRDGVYDTGEQPVAGVAVRLVDAGGNTVDDALGNPATTTTGVDGRYSFDSLLPGTYRVEFGLPAGYVWTTANVGANGTDGLDSDPVPAAPDAPTAITGPVVLTSTAVTDPDPDGLDLTNPTIDAGVVPLLSLGDLVWVDENRDGVYDPVTELPLAGVVVALLDAAGNPATDAFGVAQTATTGPDGRWSFDNLLPGDYRVSFTQPGGFVWTQPNLGADDSLDSDAVGATPGAPTATTGVFTLSSTPVGDNDPDGLDVTNPTIDAGLVPVVSLGDLVWIDLDRDGLFDVATEAGIAGVIVVLQTAVGGPVTGADGQVVPSTTTDADGRYSFDGLLPGTYRVRFTLPAGHVWTSSNTAGSDGLDNDSVPDTAAVDSPTVTTAPFVLTSTPVVDDDTSAAALDVTDPTVDAGVVPRLSVGDLVWVDADADGVQDPTELPLAGVTVTLVDGNGAPVTDVLGNPVGPTTTDADGRYSFTNLAPGDYRVVFTLPPGFSWTPDGSGPDRSLDSNADAVTPFAPIVDAGVHAQPDCGCGQRS